MLYNDVDRTSTAGVIAFMIIVVGCLYALVGWLLIMGLTYAPLQTAAIFIVALALASYFLASRDVLAAVCIALIILAGGGLYALVGWPLIMGLTYVPLRTTAILFVALPLVSYFLTRFVE